MVTQSQTLVRVSILARGNNPYISNVAETAATLFAADCRDIDINAEQQWENILRPYT